MLKICSGKEEVIYFRKGALHKGKGALEGDGEGAYLVSRDCIILIICKFFWRRFEELF